MTSRLNNVSTSCKIPKKMKVANKRGRRRYKVAFHYHAALRGWFFTNSSNIVGNSEM